MSVIVHPLTFIVATIFIGQLTMTPSTILFPATLIIRPIWPQLESLSFTHVVLSIALVNSWVFELYDFSF